MKSLTCTNQIHENQSTASEVKPAFTRLPSSSGREYYEQPFASRSEKQEFFY
jgi:hypothetical protein